HSIPPNPGGSAHMLEHLITSQSMSSDRLGQFHQQVGLCGGWANAGVASLFTMFVMSVPNQHFDALLPQFAPMIFVPSWEDDQIIKERSIIRNERTSREKWYPGKNPMSYIWQTRWQFDCPYSLEQKMGSDEDLSLMTNDALRELHQHYFSSGITVIAYGPGDITPLTSYLEQLPVGHIELSKSHEPMRWVKKEFGEIDINHIPV